MAVTYIGGVRACDRHEEGRVEWQASAAKDCFVCGQPGLDLQTANMVKRAMSGATVISPPPAVSVPAQPLPAQLETWASGFEYP